MVQLPYKSHITENLEMRKTTRIEFTDSELYKKQYNEASYALDVDTETLYITYKGKIHSFFLKNKALYFAKLVGKEKIHTAANTFMPLFEFILFLLFLLSLLIPVSFLSILLPFPLFFEEHLGISFKGYPGYFVIWGLFGLFAITVISGFIGKFLENLDKYCQDTSCKRCSKDFACDESKKPEIKEISTFEDYVITITRFWKCKYCGNEASKTDIMNIHKYKGEKTKLPEEACKKCGYNSAMSEYKRPDIKEIKYTDTIIRHYKCRHCSHREIMINEEFALFLP